MIGALFQRFALLSLSGSMVLLPLLLLAGLIQRRYRAQSCAVLWLLLLAGAGAAGFLLRGLF